jgi:hypothetical protein
MVFSVPLGVLGDSVSTNDVSVCSASSRLCGKGSSQLTPDLDLSSS